jgi:hypothetical protein
LPLKTPRGPTFGAAARDKRQANDATDVDCPLG